MVGSWGGKKGLDRIKERGLNGDTGNGNGKNSRREGSDQEGWGPLLA